MKKSICFRPGSNRGPSACQADVITNYTTKTLEQECCILTSYSKSPGRSGPSFQSCRVTLDNMSNSSLRRCQIFMQNFQYNRHEIHVDFSIGYRKITLLATFKFGLEIFTTIIQSFLAIFQCIKNLFDCLSKVLLIFI